MINTNPYQAAIVGIDTMPRGHREKWAFLASMILDLHPGQVVRLTLPKKDIRKLRPDMRWKRICKKLGKTHHSRIIQNGSDNATMYLWYENGKVERKDQPEQAARDKVQRMSTVYQAGTLQE
jgi:hypothetical protein